MRWLKDLLGQPKDIPERPDDTKELEHARKRRQQIIERLVTLGVEADVVIERGEWRREH